jgi:hypothetical protein
VNKIFVDESESSLHCNPVAATIAATIAATTLVSPISKTSFCQNVDTPLKKVKELITTISIKVKYFVLRRD